MNKKLNLEIEQLLPGSMMSVKKKLNKLKEKINNGGMTQVWQTVKS